MNNLQKLYEEKQKQLLAEGYILRMERTGTTFYKDGEIWQYINLECPWCSENTVRVLEFDPYDKFVCVGGPCKFQKRYYK